MIKNKPPMAQNHRRCYVSNPRYHANSAGFKPKVPHQFCNQPNAKVQCPRKQVSGFKPKVPNHFWWSNTNLRWLRTTGVSYLTNSAINQPNAKVQCHRKQVLGFKPKVPHQFCNQPTQCKIQFHRKQVLGFKPKIPHQFWWSKTKNRRTTEGISLQIQTIPHNFVNQLKLTKCGKGFIIDMGLYWLG